MENIYTERLLLTPWRVCIEDAKGLYAYAKDPDVGPNAGWKPHESVEESLKIIEELFVPEKNTWAIREKESNKIVGSISLLFDRRREDVNSREMGYSLAKDCWGKGYMTEAAKEVLRFAFEELGLDQVGICTSRVNRRSQRIIEKCGFTYEGTIRRYYKIYDGSLRDSMVFSMLREEFFAGKDSK